jgi:hypothetical protein
MIDQEKGRFKLLLIKRNMNIINSGISPTLPGPSGNVGLDGYDPSHGGNIATID